MEKELRAAGLRSVANARVEIIIRTIVYRFSGNYTLHDNDEPVVAEFSQFDVLLSLEGENHLVHPADVHQIERLFRLGVPTQIQIEARILKRDGDVCILSAEGLACDVQSEGSEIELLRQHMAELLHVHQIAGVAGFDIAVGADITQSESSRSLEYGSLHGLMPGTDYETHDDWKGRVHSEDRERAESILIDSLRGSNKVYRNEYRIVRQTDGQTRYILTKAEIERNKEGIAVRMMGAYIDVTESRLVERKIRETESLQRIGLELKVAKGTKDLGESNVTIREQAHFIASVASMLPDVVSVIDLPSRKISYCNRDALEMLGFSAEEISAMDAPDRRNLTHPDDREEIDKYYDRYTALADSQMNPLEFRLKNRDGKWLWIQVKGRVLKRNEKGEVVQTLGVARDITALKENIVALAQERAQLKSALAEEVRFINKVVNTIPSLISVINIDTRESEYINTTPFENEGFGKERMKQLTGEESRRLIHEEDQRQVNAYFDAFLSMSDEQVNVMEYRAKTRGTWQWYRAHGRVFSRNTEGRPTHCVNVVQNVSGEKSNEATIQHDQLEILEMKEELAQTAENKYKILFNSIEDGFCIVEMVFDGENRPEDYLFVEVNPAFERQTGLADVVGKTMRSLRPNHEQFWFDTYGHVAQSGEPISLVNIAHELGGRWYEVYAFPVRGKIANRVAILFRDISERRLFELNLQELNAKLRDRDVVKTNFFSNVSHEFRTPLALMISPLEELLKRSDTVAGSEELAHLQMAHRNALRLQKMINMLLDFFRIESGRMEAKFEETNLSDLTVDIASNFRSAIEAAGLKFIVKKLSPPQMVFVDRGSWEKIVLNLISNAFKFTHKGTIRVSIVSHRDMLQLKVRDTGIGISQQDIPKLFERFVRIERARARTNEGSGIGLAIVKELVKMHGGTIEVESEEGNGSQFTVSIPRGRDHLPQVIEGKGTAAVTSVNESFADEIKAWLPDEKNGTLIDSATVGAEEKPSVMIVDDNADMREYLLKVLTDYFVVIPAENGAQALRYLANVRPDLILTDVLMPETDGLMLLAELRKSKVYSNIPIVLLSARSGEGLKSEAIQLGADDYIAKPFSTRELIATLSARIEVARVRALSEKEVVKKHLELEQIVLERTKELVRSREDLTHANESLKQKNYELMAMNEELTNFAFIASHDLREPLRKVTLFTNELAGMTNEPMPEKARAYANKIFNSVVRMNALLDDVLDFSKMRSRSLLKYSQVNLSKVVEDVRAELSQLITDNEGVVEAATLPTISANAVQIYHLFENLIANGVKFRHPEHGSTVKIRSEVLKKGEADLSFAALNSDYLKIIFSDNGIGFEPQYTEKIFHMFQRLHRANEYNGTGMGLAICKKVMQNHKGYIFADGSPGAGAAFSCYFPLE